MAIVLRDYQTQIIEETRAYMARGKRAILICSPTGSGKTALTAAMLKTASLKGMRSMFNVHRRELIKQSLAAFKSAGIDAGVISRGFDETPESPVQIASVQTLGRRLGKYQAPKLIVWDECHHIAAGTWDKIYNYYPDAFHVGLTATPERLDGRGLEKYFQIIVKGPSVSSLIEDNYLCDYKIFAPSSIDTTGIKKSMGDFQRTQLSELMDKPTITGSALREYQKVGLGKRAVIFAVSVKHSMNVVSEFLAAGIPAKHLDGETPMDERDQALQDFNSGKTLVLSNVDLFSEGFDLPAIEIGILLRPTASLSLYLQQVGRVLRPSPGKSQAIILDHVGNTQRHGMPDQDRSWRLAGASARKAADSEGNFSVKICSTCFAAQPPGADACKYCETEFPVAAREIQQVEGELVEISKVIKKKQLRAEQGRAATLEDLYALGIKRGYKHPRRWAKWIFQARQRKLLER